MEIVKRCKHVSWDCRVQPSVVGESERGPWQRSALKGEQLLFCYFSLQFRLFNTLWSLVCPLFCNFLYVLLCSWYSVAINPSCFSNVFVGMCACVGLSCYKSRRNYFHKFAAATTTSCYYGSLDLCRGKDFFLQLAMKKERHVWAIQPISRFIKQFGAVFNALPTAWLARCCCNTFYTTAVCHKVSRPFKPLGSSRLLLLLLLCISKVFIVDLVTITKVSATRWRSPLIELVTTVWTTVALNFVYFMLSLLLLYVDFQLFGRPFIVVGFVL